MPESAGAPSGKDALDPERYFARIGYAGTPRADLDTLRALTELHPAAIPFEAVDVGFGSCIAGAPLRFDAVAANWYTSTHPASGFRRDLRLAARCRIRESLRLKHLQR